MAFTLRHTPNRQLRASAVSVVSLATALSGRAPAALPLSRPHCSAACFFRRGRTRVHSCFLFAQLASATESRKMPLRALRARLPRRLAMAVSLSPTTLRLRPAATARESDPGPRGSGSQCGPRLSFSAKTHLAMRAPRRLRVNAGYRPSKSPVCFCLLDTTVRDASCVCLFVPESGTLRATLYRSCASE